MLDPVWTTTGDMTIGRWQHTATLLKTGQVLVVGGWAPDGKALKSVELFNPDGNGGVGSWATTSSVAERLATHSASLLKSGNVLIAGNNFQLANNKLSSEYLVAQGQWHYVGNLNHGRGKASALLLHSGKVMIAGGTAYGNWPTECELYDPMTKAWTDTAPMSKERGTISATLLNSGKVLVLGGSYGAAPAVYDPATDNWTDTGPLNYGSRSGARLLLLSSGKVLLAGPEGTHNQTCELYDPATNKWTLASHLPSARSSFGLVLLPSGKALLTGGAVGSSLLAESLLYDPKLDIFTPVGDLTQGKASFTTTLLPSGDVLIAGGRRKDAPATIAQAEIFSLMSNGEACDASKPLACSSGNCVDGVCCDKTCDGLCQACSSAKKGQGANGTCGMIAADSDPDNECDALGTGVCKLPGVCDGKGACKTNEGTQCLAAQCSGDATLTMPAVCQADGTCATPKTTDCTPYKCDSGACATSCSQTLDCVAPSTCENGVCVKRPDGVACSQSAQCLHGHCVDGVCCESACDKDGQGCSNEKTGLPDGRCGVVGNGAPCQGPTDCSSGQCVDGVCCDKPCGGRCEACSAAKKGQGQDGTCGPVVAGKDPHDDCQPAGAGVCRLPGTCDGARSCTNQAGTVCGPASHCKDDTTLIKASVCDPYGGCGAETTVSCSPYHCDQGKCLTECSAGHDCVSPSTCTSGKCTNVPQGGVCFENSQCSSGFCVDGFCCDKACGGATEACSEEKTGLANGTCGTTGNGKPCSNPSECVSGFCVDGVCCDKACTNPCDGCTNKTKGSGLDGVCGPVSIGTDPHDGCDTLGWSVCRLQGNCDGAGACQYRKDTACGDDAVCSANDDLLLAQTCTILGTCGDAKEQSCGNYRCKNNECPKSCTSASDCKTGSVCVDGLCKTAKETGEKCTDDAECDKKHCVEGVCCDSPCDSPCMSCIGNKTGDADGACKNVLAGTKDPKGTCKVTDPPCGADGVCDGAGQCRQSAPQGTDCGTTCSGSSVVKQQCSGAGKCIAQPSSAETCFPYTCSNSMGACLTLCTSQSECAEGAKCNIQTSECVPKQNTCKDDWTVIATDGTETNCSPYKCSAGACLDACVTKEDCKTGYSCDSGKCVSDSDQSLDAQPADTSGCGCRIGGTSSEPNSSGAIGGLLLALGLAMSRRRRSNRVES